VIAGFRSERVLLLGNSSILGEVVSYLLRRPEFGYSFLATSAKIFPAISGSLPGSDRRSAPCVRKYRPTRIVVGMAERRNAFPFSNCSKFASPASSSKTLPTHTKWPCGGFAAANPAVATHFFFRSGAAPPCDYAAEFLFARNRRPGPSDFSPIMLVTAIIVRLTSAGPVLYRSAASA